MTLVPDPRAPEPPDNFSDGRFVMGVLGCDLAANAVGRQTCVSDTRTNAKRLLECERPALLVIAVEDGQEDAARDRVLRALNGAGA